MKMIVNLEENSYPIYIEKGLLSNVDSLLPEVFSGNKIMIITDDNVDKYYSDNLVNNLKDKYEVSKIVVEHGEQSKRHDILPSLYAQLLDFKLTRTDLIIALGGGVIGDLAGYVAATYLRGIKLVQIPTSLLAQVDSSVGGKVAVDLPQGKNLVGAFYHPKMVIIDPLTLKTLEPRFVTDGMAEVIKYGCIKDKELFDKLNSCQGFDELYNDIDEIIYRCVDIKRDVVEKDQFDFGERLLLNFGHTIGHAIEQYYNYEKYSHGEGVAIGMMQLSLISQSNNQTSEDTCKQLEEILTKYKLPIKSDVPSKELLKSIALDKKNINKSLSIILLQEIGNSFVYQTTSDYILTKEVL